MYIFGLLTKLNLVTYSEILVINMQLSHKGVIRITEIMCSISNR
jgi:hypothetical protein